MKLLYQKQKGGLIGIDIGSTSIKFLELTGNNDVYRIDKFAVIPLSEGLVVDKIIEKPDEVGAVLKRILQSQKPATKNIAFSLPMSSTNVSRVLFDESRDDQQIADEILSNLTKYTELPLSEVRVDYQIQISEAGKKEVEVLFAKNDAVDSRDDIFKNLNLVPVIATIETVAIENAFKYLSPDATNQSIALFDIGHLTTSMYVMRKGKINTSRELDIGGSHFTQAIQNFYSVSTEDAESYKERGHDDENYKSVIIEPFFQSIGDEFLQALNLYESNNSDSISRIIISGGTSNTDGLIEFLNSYLSREVEIADPFRNVQISPSIDAYSLRLNASTLLVAFGLALCKVGSVANLLPWRDEIREEKNKTYIKGALFAALVGALVGLGGYSFYKQVENQQIGANSLILETTAKYQAKIDEMKDVSNRRAIMIERMKLIQDLQTQRPVMVSVLNSTVSLMPQEMFLTAMSREGNSFIFQGKARDATVVADYLRKLKASGWFDFTFMNSFVAYEPPVDAGEIKLNKEMTYGSFIITADVTADLSTEIANKARKAADEAKNNVAIPNAPIVEKSPQLEPSHDQNNITQLNVPAATVGAQQEQPVAQNALPMNSSDSTGTSQNMVYSGGGNGL